MKINTTTQLIKVTPEIATEWLSEKWGEQRNIRNAHVARLASDMKNDRFHISPDAILRIKGKLANGQHRLMAVCHSGKPQIFLVMESNDEELYKVIDAGLRRTVGDALIGSRYCREIPSIARWVQAYQLKSECSAARTGTEAVSYANQYRYITQCEAIEYCMANQEVLTDAASFTCPLYVKSKLFPLSIGASIYAIAALHGNGKLEKAMDFLTMVYSDGGANAAGDLRNRLIANRGSRAKLHKGYIFGITLKAFKAFCNGTRPGVLKWSKDEALPSI